MYIQGGIASTTHLDYHGQRMSKKALDEFSMQIKARYMPLLDNHDFDRHIGVHLSARVVGLEDGEYALLIVSGIFVRESDAAAFQHGAVNTVWRDYESVLDNFAARVRALPHSTFDELSPEDVAYPHTLAGQLELHLDSTSVAPDGTVYLTKQRVATVRDLEINIYPKDHQPPHFHVRSRQRNMDARFHIESLEFINEKHGTIRPKEIRQIQDFFEKNPAMYVQLQHEYQRLK